MKIQSKESINGQACATQPEVGPKQYDFNMALAGMAGQLLTGGFSRVVRTDFTFADFPDLFKAAESAIPGSAYVQMAAVNITEVFDAGTIKLGSEASTNRLLGTGDIDPTTEGFYGGPTDIRFAATGNVEQPPRVTFTGTPTTGAGALIVVYAQPLP